MGSSPSGVSQAAATTAKNAGQSAQRIVQDLTQDARLAAEHGGRAAGHIIGHAPALYTAIGFALSFLADLTAGAVTGVTKVKQSGSVGIHDLIASLLSDSLLIEIDPGDIPDSASAGGQFRINAALGKKFLDVIKEFMGANGTVTGATAETGAAALLGLGMQMSVNTGLMAIIGGMVPEVHLDELKEIGEMLEKSLGLGRLNRQALRPYVRNLVSQPLDRKVRAQYRQDILGLHELVRAIFRGGPLAQSAHDLLAQHGLPDEQIAELVEQLRPHLTVAELEALVWNGDLDQAGATQHIANAGTPQQISDLQFRALTVTRLQRLREAGIGEVFAQIKAGFLPATAIQTAFATFEIPLLERSLWQAKVDALSSVPRKRLSQGEMLFLYEASQVTIGEVAQWAESEGFSSDDQFRIQLYFELKATATAQGKAKSTAAAAAHVHAEHVAYVNDVFQGATGRAPDAAELAGWVSLLDLKQRTRGDVKTEVKLNPAPPAQ